MNTPTTLCDMFQRQAAARPDSVAVDQEGRTANYGQLAEQSAAVAAWLREHGVRKGHRVVLLLPNSIEYVVCYLAVLRAGGIAVALNPETTRYELRPLLRNAAPSGIVAHSQPAAVLETMQRSAGETGLGNVRCLLTVDEESAAIRLGNTDSFEAVVENTSRTTYEAPRPDEPAQIIYTSGTTGRPKGVTLSHRNIAANCRSILEYLELTADDSVLVTLPFFYSYGNSLLFTHLAVGGRLVLASDFVFWNRVLDLMQERAVTGFSGVPSSFAMLLHRSNLAQRSFPDLRYLTCAGGGLAPAVVDQFRRTFPRVRLFLMYGQTEATARLSALMPEQLDHKPGSIGRGIPGVRLDVLDEGGRRVKPGEVGEIVARGENIMLGYWNDPEATRDVLKPEGLRTGDLARVDQDGDIYIVGRRSDMIKTGSYRLNPKEIEEVILQLGGIAEAAVVGLRDEIWGAVPVAVVVPSASHAGPTEREILRHCRTQLPRYKMIRGVRFVESLPRTSSGKIRRAELQDLVKSDTVSGTR